MLLDAETRYSTIERECLSIVWHIKHFRIYLVGTHFTVYTDHRPLKYLFNIKDPSSRLANLTRLDDTEVLHVNTVQTKSNTEITPIIFDFEQIKICQENNPAIQAYLTDEQFYKGTNGIIYKQRADDERSDKVVLPDELKTHILSLYHDNPLYSHPGQKKTLEIIRRDFFWKRMATDVKKYCETCNSCNIHKQTNLPLSPLQKMPVPSNVFGLISLDIVGPLTRTDSGNKYILTCMDYLTRYPECIPIADITATTVAKAFVTNIVLRYGAPQSLLTDMGSQFMSELFTNICQLLQIKKLHTTAYRPATNGVVERMHSVLKTMISHYVSEDQYNWDEVLPYCLCAYRNIVHESTGETPFSQLIYQLN